MKRLVGLTVALMVGLAACEDFAAPTDSGVPGSGGAFSLQKVSGDAQTGNPGQELADPYVVRVVDAAGGAVPGIPVGFAIQQGGGALSSSVVVTDSSGVASVTATLPSTINTEQTVIAGSEMAVNAVSFTSSSIATTSGAANIRIISGDGQKGIVRDTLLDPLVVEVTDGEGVVVQGVSVRWKVQGGSGGSVRENATVTNEQGLAQNRWRVGDEPGDTEEIVAWIEPDVAVPDTVSFTAELTGVPDTIDIVQGAIELDNDFNEPELVNGDTVFVAPGHWSRKPFKGIVRDADGRTVRGATLTWNVTSGGGTVGDEPDGGGAETIMLNTAPDGSISVWRRAEGGSAEGSWIGATLSIEEYPDVVPITLNAMVRQ